ncbi:MAG: sulfatase [Planctomycetota bacterium]|nr:sulfatase [Planctomycetota bacterium]
MKTVKALWLVPLLAVFGFGVSPCLDAATRPNVLFIAVDDLNNDLGCYGHSLVQSPHIDRLARRGVVFERAYCQYPVCNPSRSSFLTGLYPHQTGVLSNAGDFRKKLPDVVTLPQLFRKNGYFVARVGKLYHYGVPTQIGTNGKDDPASWEEVVNPRGRDKDDEDLIQSIAPHRNFGGTLSWLAADGADDEQTDALGAQALVEFLEKHHPERSGKPFFLAMGFYRPHTPFVAPKKYFALYPRGKIELAEDPPDDRDDIPRAALADRPHQLAMSDDRQREVIQAYYASITFMDAQVGRLLDALERLKLEKSTIIVFVSDHGYHLGRHGLWQKGDLFEGSCRAPLIIADPRKAATAGRRTRGITEFVDIYPTLVELCGLPAPGHLAGRSLAPLLDDPSRAGKPAAFTVTHSRVRLSSDRPRKRFLGYTVRTDRYRYTEWGDRAEFGVELYDHAKDPHEHVNLARQAEHRPTLARLAKVLAERKRVGR